MGIAVATVPAVNLRTFYLGRQPILDRARATVGYELLFRSGANNAFDTTVDGDTATAHVITRSLMDVGLDRLVGRGVAYINLTEHFLERADVLDCLPTSRVVFEVLEDVRATPAVLEGLATLHDAGFVIALDDYVSNEHTAAFLPYAQLVKYDITQHEMADLPAHVARDRAAGRRVLAERVETIEQFEALLDMGFDLFQGYFFAKPTILQGAGIPSDRLAVLQLMALMNRPEVSFERLAEATTREISVSVRALRFVNSPMTALAARVTSIKQALILLGRDTIRNWVMLIVMSGYDDKPAEVTSMALTRARFCQLVAQRERRSDDADYFTLGLLSLLDVVMDLPMENVLEHVGASQDFHEVLLHGRGHAGRTLAAARILERSRSDAGADRSLVGPDMAALWQDALIWTEDTKRNLPT